MASKICPRCGAAFTATGKGAGRRRYCGTSCSAAAASDRQKAARGVCFPISATCLECGVPFAAMSAKARYCSKACGVYRRNHGAGDASSRRCVVCGADIPRRSKLRRFCGKGCEMAEEARLRRARLGQDFASQAFTLGAILKGEKDGE